MPEYASALALNVGVVLAIATFAFSLMLLLVSVLSWTRVRSAKLLIVGGAFALLAFKGGYSTWGILADRVVDLPSVALDFGVLAFLYASVAVR